MEEEIVEVAIAQTQKCHQDITDIVEKIELLRHLTPTEGREDVHQVERTLRKLSP